MEPLRFNQSLAHTSLSYRHLVASFIYFVAVLSELLITAFVVNLLKEGLPDGELGVFTFTSDRNASVMAFATQWVILQHRWDHRIPLPSDLTKFWTAGNKEVLQNSKSFGFIEQGKKRILRGSSAYGGGRHNQRWSEWRCRDAASFGAEANLI